MDQLSCQVADINASIPSSSSSRPGVKQEGSSANAGAGEVDSDSDIEIIDPVQVINSAFDDYEDSDGEGFGEEGEFAGDGEDELDDNVIE